MERRGDFDVAIIGGGLAGLATAALTARQGQRVIVLERHQEVGGRANTDREHGFSLNRGAHALYGGGAARRVLDALDIHPRGVEPDGNGGLALLGEALHPLPNGPISLMWSGLLDLSGKLEVARILTALRRHDRARFADITVRELLDTRCRNESARGFLTLLIRVANYGDDFDRMSAAMALDQVRRATYDKVMYVDDGWQTIVDALAERARSAGAVFECGARVRAIEPGYRLLGDRTITAKNVVIAASPEVVASLVPTFRHKTVPVRAACLDLGLSKLPRPRTRLVLGIDRPLYLSVHSAWARVAPEGGATVHLVRYLREGEHGGTEHIAELEALMARVHPGYHEHVVVRRALPNMVVSNDRVDVGRPRASIELLPGLYLAGDWVGDEGYLADASFASAAAVAERVSVHSRAA